MEVAVKIVTLVGSLFTLSGLFWMLFGIYTLFQGRKNNRPEQRDEGQESLINGFALAAFAGGITATIIAYMQNLTF